MLCVLNDFRYLLDWMHAGMSTSILSLYFLREAWPEVELTSSRTNIVSFGFFFPSHNYRVIMAKSDSQDYTWKIPLNKEFSFLKGTQERWGSNTNLCFFFFNCASSLLALKGFDIISSFGKVYKLKVWRAAYFKAPSTSFGSSESWDKHSKALAATNCCPF